MRRIAARSWCLLGALYVASLFISASAHASDIIWQDRECWQTGQLGAETFSCENPAAAGYLATHVVENFGGTGNYKLAKSGQYCSYDGLRGTINRADEEAVFAVPSPTGDYQETDGEESVCAVWAPSSESLEWGLQLTNDPEGLYGSKKPECDIGNPRERCSIEHYFSLGGQGLNDRPWNSYLYRPALDLYTPEHNEVIDFQPGEEGFGWGYLCPVLEDRKSGNVLEICYEDWLDGGPHHKEPEWAVTHVAQCNPPYSEFEHNFDKVVVHLPHTVELYNVFTEPLKESEFPAEFDLGGKPEVELSASSMQEIVEFDNRPFKVKERSGGYNDEPEEGSGCGKEGREASSTNASEWALIGIANGVEEWETKEKQSQSERQLPGRAKATVGTVESWTSSGGHDIEVSSESATSITESEAKVTGDVNPDGYPTKYVVEYGTGSVSEHTTAEVLVGSGTSPVPVSTTLTGLSPSSTYKYRIKAFYSTVGLGEGPEQTFSTLGKPTVETKAATSIGRKEAMLNGVVNPRGAETKYYFEYGKTESYGIKTAEASAGSGTGNVNESATISGLETETTYHFRIVATNAKGTVHGLDKTFTTLPPTWSIQSAPSPTGATVSNLNSVSCSSSTACTAVGFSWNGKTETTLAEQWNGTGWSIQTTPNPRGEFETPESVLTSVACTSANACVAVGYYVEPRAGYEGALAERWNGTEWSSQPLQESWDKNELLGVSCSSSTACTAVGWYRPHESHAPFAERWNGTGWSIQTPPNASESIGTDLASVSCPSATACTAVGWYRNGSSGAGLTLAERWNGTEWSLQTTPNPSGGAENSLSGVSCPSTSACVAIGSYRNSSSAEVTLAEVWSGSGWSIQTSANPSGAYASKLTSLSCTATTACMAAGRYEATNQSPEATLAERLMGSEWAIKETEAKGVFQGVSCSSSTHCAAAGNHRTSTEDEVNVAERYE